jgi:hypothetical protein
MHPPKMTTLYFAPAGAYVEATIAELTASRIEQRMHLDWWNDPSLLRAFAPEPIDRRWNWNEMQIEIGGRVIPSTIVGITTGDNAVQGAMMISTESIPSAVDPTGTCLFVELLFTAPRNRPTLRRDGGILYQGAGSEFMKWAASFSEELGCEGRFALDASPEFVGWYEKRGLKVLDAAPILFEGTSYMPMEFVPDQTGPT